MIEIEKILNELEPANTRFSRQFPGDPTGRQPVHVVYGGAQLFDEGTIEKLGRGAIEAFREAAPDASSLAGVLGLEADSPIARKVHERVSEKLAREPVEDYRIDFEDGFGIRPDSEEDSHAERAGKAASRARLPEFFGIRLKALNEEMKRRSARTLEIFVKAMEKVPPGFRVTLAKVTVPEQVEALARILDLLEAGVGAARGAIRVEIMVETPQSVIGPEGALAARKLVDAARGRCAGAHFGTYDYTAGLNITAAHQHMDHVACSFARDAMQVALAGSGVLISDGATNIMPVGGPEGIRAAWRVSRANIRHSLERGYYQGWDLHPAQLPIRFATLYQFFLESLPAATARLRAFLDKATQATLLGEVFDDAATGQGLLNFFLRGMSCGAITESEARETGLTPEEIRGRSFSRVLETRRSKG